jgi:hypothetical protein
MTSIDTIVIMRDGEIIKEDVYYTFNTFYTVDLHVEKGGTYYYTVYVVNQAGMSKVVRDTIMVGPTCDLRFELADSGNNGWDLSFIAVLDEDGKVSQRVGLMEGGEASVIVPVPSGQTATLFWTYDNTCYSHGSLSEVSYEVYDWDDNLIVASNGYPEVGEIIEYDIECGLDCQPVEMAWGEYQWTPEGYKAVFGWNWTGEGFDYYNIYREGNLIDCILDPNQMQYTDVNPPMGSLTYGVTVRYRVDGETCESEMATIDVAVTSVGENQSGVVLYPNPASSSFTVEGSVKEISVYDVLGQRIYQGFAPVVDVTTWPEGMYFVRIVDENDAVSTVKFLKR